MKRDQTLPRPDLSLFEINLIGDRVGRLRGRRRLSRVGDVATVMMVVAALVCCVLTAFNLLAATRAGYSLRKVRSELAEAQRAADELDRLRDAALDKVGKLKLLVPVAKRRIRWAPKLAALASALPQGMGVTRVNVSGNDFFTASGGPKKGNRSSKFGLTNIDEAHLYFAVIYLPRAGKTADPMGDLRDNLQASDAFMEKMQFVRLERQTEEIRNEVQVQVFEGLLKGIRESKRK